MHQDRFPGSQLRLPEERLDKDISDILESGVKFVGKTAIGKDLDLAQLKKDFDAVYLAGGDDPGRGGRGLGQPPRPDSRALAGGGAAQAR